MENQRYRVKLRVIKDHFYHYYNGLTIIMVISGKIKLRAWATDNYMKEGDLIVLNPYEMHRLTAITEKNLVIITVIEKNFCKKIYKKFDETIIICNSVDYSNFNEKKYRTLKKLLLDLIKFHEKNYCECCLNKKVTTLIKYICKEFDYISFGNRNKKFTKYSIDRYRFVYKEAFLENGVLYNKTLKEISEILGVNYTYLRTDILERFGHGFKHLKYRHMTEKAAYLITTTNLRLIDISNQCGFSDQKYLRKYIKKFYECTPSEFRKIHKNINKNEKYIEVHLGNIIKYYTTF